VGRIFTTHTPEGERWRWSITSVFTDGMPTSGYTDTLEDAKREFAATWRAWLVQTGRDEETYRPRYGKPMDLGRDERPIPDCPEQG
jgi:hypothetical protein